MENWCELVSWTYSGINYSLAGNGGPECSAMIPGTQRIAETVFVVVMSFLEVWLAYPHLKLPDPLPLCTDHVTDGGFGRRILLVIMCLTFGIELGFKFASRQMIWILNPCHIVTMMQIFLLVAPPSRFAMALFRLHIHWLSGATIALVLPVLNTRLLPFEVHVYYIQHIMMLVIPLFLLRLGGIYTIESMTDFSWSLAASGLAFAYHFLPLQLLAVTLQVNLNSILCPAVSDPFYGRWYRIWAIVHQSLYIVVHGKIYTYFALLVVPRKSLDIVTSNGYSKHD